MIRRLTIKNTQLYTVPYEKALQRIQFRQYKYQFLSQLQRPTQNNQRRVCVKVFWLDLNQIGNQGWIQEGPGGSAAVPHWILKNNAFQ
jgi:hypothetical protein